MFCCNTIEIHAIAWFWDLYFVEKPSLGLNFSIWLLFLFACQLDSSVELLVVIVLQSYIVGTVLVIKYDYFNLLLGELESVCKAHL